MISTSVEANIPFAHMGAFPCETGHFFAVTDDTALSNVAEPSKTRAETPYEVGQAPLVRLRTFRADIFRRSKRVYTQENSSPRIFKDRWTGRHRGSGTCPRMGFPTKHGTKT